MEIVHLYVNSVPLCSPTAARRLAASEPQCELIMQSNVMWGDEIAAIHIHYVFTQCGEDM